MILRPRLVGAALGMKGHVGGKGGIGGWFTLFHTLEGLGEGSVGGALVETH